MDIIWSEEQRKAIYTHDKNIIISASAGAGKTMVLIGRLMHLIEDLHYDIDEILAMTFSEAAANEMKKRLTKNLQESLVKNPDDEFLYQQLAKVNDANISTIHGFCLQVLKEYYYVIGLDKERLNNPLSDSVCQSLKLQALDDTLADYYNHEGFADLTEMLDKQVYGNENLKQAIMDLAELANSQSDPQKFLQACVDDYYNVSNLKELPLAIYNNFKQYFITKIELYIAELTKYHEEYEKDIDQKLAYLQDGLAVIDNDYDHFVELVKAAITTQAIVKSKAKVASDLQDELLSYLFSSDEFIKFHNALVKPVHLLVEITKKYLLRYDELKVLNHGIDFNDMEHLAMEIMQANNQYVAKLYRQRFKTIMVDEFQDTNNSQNDLVNLISRGNNVFRVGDIKQSIYGFRHALPAIMENLVYHPKEQDEVVFLSSNYRSGANIVNFNNLLFDHLMNIDGIDATYGEKDCVNCGSSKQELITYPTKMHLLDVKAINEGFEKPLKKDQIKAEYIAKLIQNFINDGYNYSDIAILIRSNDVMYDIKKVLDNYHIPCFFTNRKGLYRNRGIEEVISFLNCLVNPYDDLNMVAMLTSRFFMVSYDELASKHLADPEAKYYSLYEGSDLLKPFDELYRKVNELSISDVVNEILKINHFYYELIDNQTRANIDTLYAKICDFEKDEDLSLASLVEHLSVEASFNNGEAMSFGSNDDVVNIMSIHASKGLEYKVVIIYEKNHLKTSKFGNYYFDSDTKVALNYVDNDIEYPTVEMIGDRFLANKERLEEELRLLYVATTRAEEQMHIVCELDGEANEYNLITYLNAKGYSSWIRDALRFSDPNLYIEEIVEDFEFARDVDESKKQVELPTTYAYQIENSEYISPSALKLINQDVKPLSEVSYVGSERGTRLHKMVEILPNSEWDLALLEKVNETYELKLNSYDLKLLMNLNNNDMFKNYRLRTVYKEMPFIYQDKHNVVNGYMDYVAINEKEVVMIDFKSDGLVDLNELKDKYQSQIKLYQKALKAMYPDREIHTLLYSFKLADFIEVC